MVVGSRTIYVSGYILQADPAAASCSYTGIYCIRSYNNFCLIIVVQENDLSGQTYLYKIIYRHSQILANTPNIMGTLRSAECPRNIERITSSKIFSLGVVYSKPLGGKSRIVKLAREMKKKIGSFTWAVLYDISVLNSLQDIRHNHWTIKYRSNWPTYTLRSLLVSHETNIQCRTFLYQIVYEIWGRITGPWNIGHTDQIIFWGHSSCHMELISKAWHFSIK